MCSVSISDQEVSLLGTVTATIVSTTVTDPVRTSGILTYHAADMRDYTRVLET